MAATEPLCHAIGINPRIFSREESLILEAELFIHLCEELKNHFYTQHEDYHNLIKFCEAKEITMLEDNFLRYVISDILLTEEYSLEGIAYHTQIPEDIICDVATGKNTAPSLTLSRKIIDLHRNVRPTLYKDILKKITLKAQEL